MPFTKKEQNFLKDLQSEEKLCTQKYHNAAEAACDKTLKQIFIEIEKAEQGHYDTVTKMLAGEMPPSKSQSGNAAAAPKKQQKSLKSTASRAEKQQDAFLLSDLLATEKYVAGAYNTAVFEFCDEKARGALSAIQQQEQQHGKELSDYMQANNIYC